MAIGCGAISSFEELSLEEDDEEELLDDDELEELLLDDEELLEEDGLLPANGFLNGSAMALAPWVPDL